MILDNKRKNIRVQFGCKALFLHKFQNFTFYSPGNPQKLMEVRDNFHFIEKC